MRHTTHVHLYVTEFTAGNSIKIGAVYELCLLSLHHIMNWSSLIREVESGLIREGGINWKALL